MKHQLLFAASALLLSSCALQNYYQVYEVETIGLKDKGNLLVYENEDCTVSYSLWGENGDLSFVFENKLDQNLYLIMPQCFLIHNGWALDYYDNNTYSYTSSSAYSASVSAQASLYGFTRHYDHWHPTSVSSGAAAAATASYSNTITYKAPEVICIPAKSSKVINGFKMTNTVHLECDKSKNNFPKISSCYMHYDQTNTPLFVNNVISYSLDSEGSNLKKIENTFWVSSFTNYSHKGAVDIHTETDCATGLRSTVATFKMSQPNRFYNVYNKKTSRGSFVNKMKASGAAFR